MQIDALYCSDGIGTFGIRMQYYWYLDSESLHKVSSWRYQHNELYRFAQRYEQ